MDGLVTSGPLRFFLDLPDPRAANVRYRLIDLLVIAVCAVVCDCDTWDEVEDFARSKRTWFESFLDLRHGIPCHDTFERVFARIDPGEFERCFAAWTGGVVELSRGKLLAIDGQSIRRSFERSWDKSGMAHMVSLFAQENGQVLAQLKADGKGMELAGILKLLGLVDLDGAVVTIDALGCQKEVAQTVLDRGGDYILCVKDNQPTLHDALKRNLDAMTREAPNGPGPGPGAGPGLDRHDQTDAGHGRVETRRVWVTDRIEWLNARRDWPGLKSVAVVESRRAPDRGEPTVERRYYVASLANPDAARFARAVRGHWGIENGLHHVLDVSFHEDASRIRKGHGPENMSRLRRIALNLLKATGDKLGKRRSIKGRRKIAGWDHDFLLGLLTH